MKFTTQKTSATASKSACIVVFSVGDTLLPSAATADKQLGGILSQAIKQGDLKSEKSGEHYWAASPSSAKLAYSRVLLISLGKKHKKQPNTISEKSYIAAMLATANTLLKKPVETCVVALDDTIVVDEHNVKKENEWLAHHLSIEFTRSQYRYTTTTQNKNTPKIVLNKVTLSASNLITDKHYKKGLNSGAAIGAGINTARELGNLPGNYCTPSFLADSAKKLSTKSPALTTKILTEKQMEKLGMGSLLSVSHGSVEEAKLIVMEYKKGKYGAKNKPHVLVGKGITFDTGGISLKSGGGMDEMKFDMCGAASVMGTFKALVEMKADVHAVGIIAAAENMPSGIATKPGDVVTSMSGQTIEVLNTDAEGRLVLCDALTYAERFTPKSVVDIATLTGACVVALGKHASALYANDQALAETLLSSGQNAHDRAWQMPLWDEYQNQLDSNFADMANIGGPGAGSVTAACFLSRFTKKFKWAHLDIAGTAWHGGAIKGATGRPVGLLVDYLLNN